MNVMNETNQLMVNCMGIFVFLMIDGTIAFKWNEIGR